MSPMPTPEYEEHLGHLVRKANREGKSASRKHLAPGDDHSGSRDLPHPLVLDTPISDPELQAEVMRAHRAWAKIHAPWLLEEWLDG